jgi:UDP-glucose 4-epimerase
MPKIKILITGSSGYIGSCLNIYLKKSFEVYLIDKEPYQKWSKVSKKYFYRCDLKNKINFKKFILKIKPDIIIHLAGQSTVDESISWKNYNDNNYLVTKNILSIMNEVGINKIIFSSTAAVYKPKDKKIYEKDVTAPSSKYGKSKLKSENLLTSNKKICSIIFRFFNVCSALKKPLIGEYHKPETHLIPIMISKFSKNKVMEIFGSDYNTKDGTCIRDYIHIFDICNAIKKSIYFIKNKKCGNYKINLGSGKGYSNKEIANIAMKLMRHKTNLQYVKKRKGDSQFLVCDIKKAKNILGWKPKKSTIKNIILNEIYWNKYLLKKNVSRV